MPKAIRGDLQVSRHITAAGSITALDGRQAGRILIESQVDFTTAEPAHVDNAIYMNTVTGTGSTTTGTTFTANLLYQSNGTSWTEITPVEGYDIYDRSTDSALDYDGTTWNEVGANLTLQTLTDAGTTAWDSDSGANATWDISDGVGGVGNRTLGAIANIEQGSHYHLTVTAMASEGDRDVTFDATFTGIGTVTVADGTAQHFHFFSPDGTNLVRINSDEGGLGGLSEWAATTTYSVDDIVITPTGALVKKIADGDSTATFDATEAALWTYVGWVSIPNWAGSTYYYAGQKARTASRIEIQASSSHTSAATFDDGEASSWIITGQQQVADWAATTGYMVDQHVVHDGRLLQRNTSGTSSAQFDATEEADWKVIANYAGGINTWAATTYYTAGTLVVTPGGAIVKKLADGDSTAAFDATEAALWSYVTSESTLWLASTYYYAQQTVLQFASNVYLLRLLAGVSGATFDAAEAVFWNRKSQPVVNAWSASTVFLQGQQVRRDGDLYQANATFTSAADWQTDASAWTKLVERDQSMARELFPTSLAPSAGTGASAHTDTPWGSGHLVTLSDSDAAAVTQLDGALGETFANTDTMQFRIDLQADTANANHVVRIAYEDDGGNSAEEFVEIGTGGQAIVAGGADAGNVTASATTLVGRLTDLILERYAAN